MPALGLDVKELPDIIEAQLTLSYTRLSELIRVLVEQGNAHDDEIVELREHVNRLEQQNSALLSELSVLKSGELHKNEILPLQAAVAALQQQVQRLEVQAGEQPGVIADAIQVAADDEALRRETALQESYRKLLEMEENVKGCQSAQRVLQQFYELWGAEDAKVEAAAAAAAAASSTSSAPAAAAPTEPKLEYLQSLPIFQSIKAATAAAGGLGGLEGLVPTMFTKSPTAGSGITANNSGVATPLGSSTSHPTGAAEGAGRGTSSSPPEGATTTTSTTPVMGGHEFLYRLQARLEELENRFKDPSSPSQGGSETPVIISREELERRRLLMEQRVNQLEEMVLGVKAAMSSAQQDTATYEAAPTPPTGSYMGDYLHYAPALANGNPPMAPLPPPPRRANSATGERVLTSGSVPGATSSSSVTIPTGGGGDGAGDSSRRRSLPSNPTVDQPHVARLRQDSLAAAQFCSSEPQSPKVTILEPDEGLSRRVEQLEENIAMLELKKADRSEMAVLEEALRQLLIQTATRPRGEEVYPHPPGGNLVNPGRPVYVSGGSVPLRDAKKGKRTAATVSSTQGSGSSPARLR